MNSLKTIILELVDRKFEGDYWDFKQKWHSKSETLIHDIICFANTVHIKDCYLIFGISDDFAIVGLEGDENRKTQAMVIDLIDNCKFAGDNKPEIALETIQIVGKEIDVLTIYNNNKTPIYIEKKNNSHKSLSEGFIYSRYLDRNTPKNQNSNYWVIEELWKKRFNLNRNPLEEFNELLKDKENWVRTREGYYYKSRPEFTITEVDEENYNKEVYSYLMTNSSTSYRELELRYRGTILNYFQGAILDSGRYSIICPEKGFFKETSELYCRDMFPYRYYINDSLGYNLHGFLYDIKSDESRFAKSQFDSIITIFNSVEEKISFERYLEKHRAEFEEILSEILLEDIYIEESNERVKYFVKKEIVSSKAIKRFVMIYRSELL